MNILITGANGFIGKNLIYNLILNKKFKIFKVTRKTSVKNINTFLKKTDVIYHLAGVSRPTGTSKNFNNDNIKLTKQICDYLLRNKLKKKIIFSSSTQARLNNKYGKSKKMCENILYNYAKKSRSSVCILRFPNIFGKWSKPNYNSVVSTFCYNISRDKSIIIHNPNNKVKLIYIDDVIEILKKFLNNKNKKKLLYNIKSTKTISVKKLSEIILKFEKDRKKFLIRNLLSKFEKNLYSTYVSFLPKKKFSYKLISKNDKRGSFTEFLKTKNSGQISVFIAKKNQVRGHHFHHSKVEKFLVLKGRAQFNMKDISSNQKIKFNLNENNPKVVESIPGWQHYIKNVGNNELIVLLWSNEIFNINKPDTYQI